MSAGHTGTCRDSALVALPVLTLRAAVTRRRLLVALLVAVPALGASRSGAPTVVARVAPASWA
jgi:hypothetical protein